MRYYIISYLASYVNRVESGIVDFYKDEDSAVESYNKLMELTTENNDKIAELLNVEYTIRRFNMRKVCDSPVKRGSVRCMRWSDAYGNID